MKPSRRLAVYLASAIVLIAIPAFSFTDRRPFDIAADAVDYVDATQDLIAEGHAVVIQDSSTLKADYLHYDRIRRRLQARGNVVLRENGQIMAGQYLDYDLDAQKAIMTEPKAYASSWLFQGGSWEKVNDYYIGREGAFTSCDLPDAHYFFRAKRIHYVPDDRFWAWNTVMYADGVPVFYLPFVQKPLGPQRVTFQAQPGSDSANGTFARTVTTLRYTDTVYQRLFYDYYSITGNGFGTELDYAPNPRMRGTFYGYYIDPKTAPDVIGAPSEPQYNIRSDHWQKLSETLTLQSNVNMRKNVSFNNLFFRQDDNQGVSEVFNSIALTQQTKRVNQRVVLEADQAPDPGADPLFGDTHLQTASLPRYEYTMYQVPLWSPTKTLPPGATAQAAVLPKPGRVGALNFNMSGSAQELYYRLDDHTRAKVQNTMNLAQSYTLSRDLTLTPSLVGTVRWQDRQDPASSSTFITSGAGALHGVQGLVGTSTNMRYRVSSDMTLDQTYTLTTRMEPNGFALDRGPDDGGIESNSLSWILVDRPSPALLLRSYSGYDFRRLENEDPNAYRQRRVSPWTSELTITPRSSNFDAYLQYQLGYYPTRVNTWEISGNYRGVYKTIVQSAFLYNRGTEGVITWNNTVGFYFSPGWRLDGSLNSLVPSGRSDQPGKVIDTELIVVRDLHCWNVQFIVRNRPPIAREYSILANLRFGPTTPKKIEDKDLEAQFYPWRAGVWAP